MRHLAAILVATLLVGALFLSIGLSRSFASTGHNCAPYPPPLLTGTLVNPAATPGTLFINEVLLQPHSIWNCAETGGYFSTRDAWIELYNPQNQPLNLYAAHTFIDTGSSINSYNVPVGTAIAAHSFLVLFPFYSPTFRITASMTSFRLVIGTTVIDQVAVPALGPDQSYARTYDGGPGWQITATPLLMPATVLLQFRQFHRVAGAVVAVLLRQLPPQVLSPMAPNQPGASCTFQFPQQLHQHLQQVSIPHPQH